MWKKSEYTKSVINEAGRHINDANLDPNKKEEYLRIIDNWRAAHAFPMNTFAINLKHQVSSIKSAIVVQRLKRLDTIIEKLNRYPTMELFRMQDLGGCRVIVPSIEDVYKVKSALRKSRIRHEIHNEKDYIAIPKPDTGYRGIHIIYKYKSDRNPIYDGLQVEIQIRTRLQHLWATAVETVGIFTQNGLKFNQGSEKWLRFFKLASALFSLEENSAIVEGVPTSRIALIKELLSIMKELDVVQKLYTIGLASLQVDKKAKSKNSGYYLLVLDTEIYKLSVMRYNSVEIATNEYNKIENLENKKINAVLVSAPSFDALTSAYPNYFADINDFTTVLLNSLPNLLNTNNV